MSEFDTKQRRIQALLEDQQLDALLLRRASSFAWATCGAASYINTASTYGQATLLITPSERYLLTDNIEAPRLEQEENLARQGWQFRVVEWHNGHDTIRELTGGLKLGADDPYPDAVDLSDELARMRADLTPEEGAHFRELGRLCAEAMDSAARAIESGQSEYQIAARLAYEAGNRGVQPIVNLIATDERIATFRHPLPTDKRLERYAMLVLCGRRRGLVASITRLVYFGSLPEALHRKARATAQVDATFIAETRPGQVLGSIFHRATEAYADNGFADEWKLHHQGGPAGYEPREFIVTPASTYPVTEGQVYAWNPSITGTKSEDTIMVGVDGNEVLTAIPNWPTYQVEVDGQRFERPAILELQ